MNENELNEMRTEFLWVVEAQEFYGTWSRADSIELGNAIKEALDKGDPEIIACWRTWIRKHLEFITELKAMTERRVRAFEKSIKDARLVAA